MIAPAGDVKVVVATQPVDFRRGINGLVALVASALAADPYCGDVFVFRPKRGDRLRLLFWDGSGMVLVSKWLESGRFTWSARVADFISIASARMSVKPSISFRRFYA